MRSLCFIVASGLVGSMTTPSLGLGGPLPAGLDQPSRAAIDRRESPRMRRQAADGGQLLPLYEAWMIEMFCGRRQNQRRLGGQSRRVHACCRRRTRRPVQRAAAPARAARRVRRRRPRTPLRTLHRGVPGLPATRRQPRETGGVMMRAACMLSVLALIALCGSAHGAARPPFWGAWQYWFTSGVASGDRYGSESAARAAIEATYANFYGCPATVHATGAWYWGGYAAGAYPSAYLKHADVDYEIDVATGADCDEELPPIQLTLRRQRDELPPVCPADFGGPFAVAPDGPWYECRDHERNFFENPLTADCPPTAGNPCELTTGAKIERVVDYSGPGIEFVRTYRSNLMPLSLTQGWPWAGDRYGVIGGNWTHNFNAFILHESGPFRPTHLVRPSGAVLALYEVEPHVFAAENGSGIQLRPVEAGDYGGAWVVYLPSGAREVYRPHPRSSLPGQAQLYLKELHDARGRVTTVHYALDASGYEVGGIIRAVVGPFGHQLEFFYSTTGSYTSLDYLVDPAGNRIDFVHREHDFSLAGPWLRGVVYQDGARVTYRYEDHSPPPYGSYADFFVRGIVDENGDEYATFDYYDEETGGLDLRTQSTRHGDYELTTFEYAYAGESATVTDALGNRTVYEFQPTPDTDPHDYAPGWVARNPAAVTGPRWRRIRAGQRTRRTAARRVHDRRQRRRDDPRVRPVSPVARANRLRRVGRRMAA